MAAKHIEIARQNGPKAGFNAYVETLERSGLDTAQASLSEIRSKGNKKAQFDFYCAKFGSKFGTTPVKVDESDDLQEQLRVLQARLAELQEQGVGIIPMAEAEDVDTSLDEVDDGWTQADTDAENARGRSLIQRALNPKRSSSRSSTPAQPKEAKENLWHPWAITRFGIPTKVGGTFTYRSKRAGKNTVHQVTRITEEGVYAKRIK